MLHPIALNEEKEPTMKSGSGLRFVLYQYTEAWPKKLNPLGSDPEPKQTQQKQCQTCILKHIHNLENCKVKPISLNIGSQYKIINHRKNEIPAGEKTK